MYPRNPQATLWLFAYQNLTVETHVSIVRELLAWPNLHHHVKASDANIDRARSKVASAYLQEKEEDVGSVLLMVDSDNAWKCGDLSVIAKQALEMNAVVGGIYPKRAFGTGMAFRPAQYSVGEYLLGGEDILIPADFVGTGFVAIPRVVLEAIGETLPDVAGGFKPFFMPFVIQRDFGTEYPTDDAAFCKRAIDAGFNVYASTFPTLTHKGEYEYRAVDAEVHPPLDRQVTLTISARPRLVYEDQPHLAIVAQ